MTPEERCRILCVANGINPDAEAPEIFQNVPGFKRDESGKVRMWQTWLTTVQRKPAKNRDDKRAEQSRATIQRIIDETSGPGKPVYSCYEEVQL